MPPQLVPDLPLTSKLAFNLGQTEAELALFLFQAGTLKHYAQQRVFLIHRAQTVASRSA